MIDCKVDLKSMNHQRKVLGVLCLLLAPLSFFFGFIGKNNYPDWYMSISDTFYANSNIFMIGLLFAIGVYFMCYVGYDMKDRITSFIEGFASFGIILFPTPTNFAPNNIGLFQLPQNISGKFHNTFAAILFITFAFNVLFLFTLSNSIKSKEKKLRNKIYYICGSTIVLFMISQILYVLGCYNLPDTFPMTLINEFGMLIPFGLAYLIKSETFKFLNDKK